MGNFDELGAIPIEDTHHALGLSVLHQGNDTQSIEILDIGNVSDLFEIGWRSAKHLSIGQELLCHIRHGGQNTCPDAQIKVLADQIRGLFGKYQFQTDIGIALTEFREDRRQDSAPNAKGGINTNKSVGRFTDIADMVFELLIGLQDFLACVP